MNLILNKDLVQTFHDMQNKRILTDYSPCFIAATTEGRNIPICEYLCTVYKKSLKKYS